MTKSIRQLRLIAFHRQDHKCFYCELPIWEEAVEPFAAKYDISLAQAELLRSTAEHLVAQRDGGRNTPDNIVAACAWCNRKRHAGRSSQAPMPQAYKCRVAKRIALGKWHPTGLAAAFRRNGQRAAGDCKKGVAGVKKPARGGLVTKAGDIYAVQD